MVKNDIIRVDDRIIIKNPEFFVRCGYPFTLEMMIDKVEDKWKQDINNFLKKLGLPIVYDKIVAALAYGQLKKEKFGGIERKIYTKRDEKYKDKEFTVKAIRYVKTGTYNSGSYSSGYYGDGEYEPPYLSNAKTHKILLISYALGKYSVGCEIEAIHVEKI